MTRSSNTDKTHRLNAAFDLLAKGYTLAEAAEILTQQFGLSRRQAYRYLQDAQFSRQAAPPWLIAPGEVMILSWNMLLIVCKPPSWSKHLPSWFLTGNAVLMNPQD
jgi:hypothetical protein